MARGPTQVTEPLRMAQAARPTGPWVPNHPIVRRMADAVASRWVAAREGTAWRVSAALGHYATLLPT